REIATEGEPFGALGLLEETRLQQFFAESGEERAHGVGAGVHDLALAPGLVADHVALVEGARRPAALLGDLQGPRPGAPGPARRAGGPIGGAAGGQGGRRALVGAGLAGARGPAAVVAGAAARLGVIAIAE